MADILTTSLSLLAGTPSECAAFLNSPIPVVFPAHPRTENRLREFGLYDRLAQASHVQLMPPVSYLDMLVLPKNCVLVMTDSGAAGGGDGAVHQEACTNAESVDGEA